MRAEMLKFCYILFYIHIGGSTFELPDLSPLFPHFPSSGKTEEDYSYYLFNLKQHTEKIKTAFGSLVFDLQKNLEQSNNLQDVICYLKYIIFDENFKKELNGCTCMAKVLEKLYTFSILSL